MGSQRIQNRRGKSSEWGRVNPVLMSGELGIETDTCRMKVGDGVRAWTGLDYVGGVSSETGGGSSGSSQAGGGSSEAGTSEVWTFEIDGAEGVTLTKELRVLSTEIRAASNLEETDGFRVIPSFEVGYVGQPYESLHMANTAWGMPEEFANDNYTVYAIGLPPGLSCTKDEVTGVPEQAGVYSVTMYAIGGKYITERITDELTIKEA